MNEAVLKEHVARVSQDQKHLTRRVDTIDDTLRGVGSDIGIVGRVNVLWKTWIVTVWAAGTVCGYVLRWWFNA